MPESKVRDTAAKKKSAKARAKAAEKAAEKAGTAAGYNVAKPAKKKRTKMRGAGTDWVPWVFVPLALLGVLWLLLFYIAGNRIPVMQDLRDWNYLIGIGLIAASFGVATMWK